MSSAIPAPRSVGGWTPHFCGGLAWAYETGQESRRHQQCECAPWGDVPVGDDGQRRWMQRPPAVLQRQWVVLAMVWGCWSWHSWMPCRGPHFMWVGDLSVGISCCSSEFRLGGQEVPVCRRVDADIPGMWWLVWFMALMELIAYANNFILLHTGPKLPLCQFILVKKIVSQGKEGNSIFLDSYGDNLLLLCQSS